MQSYHTPPPVTDGETEAQTEAQPASRQRGLLKGFSTKTFKWKEALPRPEASARGTWQAGEWTVPCGLQGVGLHPHRVRQAHHLQLEQALPESS